VVGAYTGSNSVKVEELTGISELEVDDMQKDMVGGVSLRETHA